MRLGHPSRALQSAGLFIRSPQKDHIAFERHLRALEREQRHELRDAERLHIHRAAAIDETILDDSSEWIDAPELTSVRNDIQVIEQDDRSPAAITTHASPDASAPRE